MSSLQVDIMLACTHIICIPVESIILVPNIGDEVHCAKCHANHKVTKVGTPYKVTYIEKAKDNDNS